LYRYFLSLRYIVMRPINWIGTLSIFVAVSALILILAIMSGFLEESRKHLRGHLSDVIVTPSFDVPISSLRAYPSRDTEGILAEISKHPSVVAAAPQLVYPGMLVPPRSEVVMTDPDGMGMVMVSFLGVDIPAEYGATSLLQDFERETSFGAFDQRPADLTDPFAYPKNYRPNEDERPRDPIIMGEQLAVRWGLHKGSELELATATLDPDTGSFLQAGNRRVVVVGTFRSSFNAMDLSRVYLQREDLADWLGRPGQYSQVVVKLEDYERDSENVINDLRTDLSSAGYLHPLPDNPMSSDFSWELQTWENSRGSMLAAIENERALLGIMLGLVLLVAGFGVFAILSMMVSEKRRDIGILTALGATPSGILTLFLAIGGIEALVGMVLGVLTGIAAAHNINEIENWLSSVTGYQIFDREIYYFDHIPTVVEMSGIVAIASASVLTALVAAAVPALRAAYLNPVDALRYE
jgi:lipoprotein-releasing system permease protein